MFKCHGAFNKEKVLIITCRHLLWILWISMSKLDNSDPRNRGADHRRAVPGSGPFVTALCQCRAAIWPELPPDIGTIGWRICLGYFLLFTPCAVAGVAMCPSVCRIMLCIIKYQYSRSTLRGSIIVYIYNLYLVCHYLIGEKLRAPILKLHSDIEMLLLFLRAALCGLGRAAACGAAEQLIRHIRLVPQIG